MSLSASGKVFERPMLKWPLLMGSICGGGVPMTPTLSAGLTGLW